jgi:predicted nucleotidyltransferase/predicted HD phosphohydrolase
MSHTKLRRQIAWEAARLMYERIESEYYQAKMKAARRICRGWVKPADLPSNSEIRDEIQQFARMFEGDQQSANLRQMRTDAFFMMKRLTAFRPRLIGSVLTGHVREGSDIDIHVFCDSVDSICQRLDNEGFQYDVQRKQVRKDGESRTYVHIHVSDRFPFELTVYAADHAHVVMKSSITHKAQERASIAELEKLLISEYPDIELDSETREIESLVDRFQMYEALLLPLERVKQGRKHHPEGDALYHSLQVFDLARDEVPYDEEFLLAALLHDVGKAIDPGDHVLAGLQALDGFITRRTFWLIEHHMTGHKLLDGTVGRRMKRRLQACEYYDDLVLLARCDEGGRQRGVPTPDVDEALDYCRELEARFEY